MDKFVAVGLVFVEDVAGVDAGGDVGKVGRGAVGEDSVGTALELGEVVDHAAAEECGAIFECRLVYDYRGAFCLYALHDALDG